MTPLEVEILLHYHTHTDDIENLDFEAQSEAIDRFVREGFLTVSEGLMATDPEVTATYRPTEKLHKLCDLICAMPDGAVYDYGPYCGLKNTWITNGYQIHQTGYGQGVSISDLHGLHKAIVFELITKPRPLMGDEFRFLRIEADLGYKDFSALSGFEAAEIESWEVNDVDAIPLDADAVVRRLCATPEKPNKKRDGRWWDEFSFTVMVYKGPDAWYAKAIEFGLLGHGESPFEAVESLGGVVACQMEFAIQENDREILFFRQ